MNRGTNNKPIEIGSNILLKKHVQGRSKMQDNWNPTPYRVVHRFIDNVYGIQLADGSGPIRNVTRREICDTEKPDLVLHLLQYYQIPVVQVESGVDRYMLHSILQNSNCCPQ
jgi:hypothetical protein